MINIILNFKKKQDKADDLKLALNRLTALEHFFVKDSL